MGFFAPSPLGFLKFSMDWFCLVFYFFNIKDGTWFWFEFFNLGMVLVLSFFFKIQIRLV
jgi:hypothetical protein